MRLDQGNESWRPFFRLPRKGKGAIGGTRQNDSQREAIRPLPLEPASTPHDTPACSSFLLSALLVECQYQTSLREKNKPDTSITNPRESTPSRSNETAPYSYTVRALDPFSAPFPRPFFIAHPWLVRCQILSLPCRASFFLFPTDLLYYSTP